MSARVAAIGASLAVLVSAFTAQADPMDTALERLVTNPTCKTELGEIVAGAECRPDHAAFKKMMNQFGFALAPTAMHSARTTGFGGFKLSLEAVYTTIDGDKEGDPEHDYFRRGTQGPVDPSSNNASVVNSSPQSILQLYSVRAIKGFGFGFEVTGSVGFMPKTNILQGGSDIRWSLLEGFRTGLLGILPDVAVGAGVRTITGAPQFQLTVSSVDAQISKPLAIQDSSVLTPWIGFQHVWIFGDSGLIDLTPATDALQYCNYQGEALPGNPVATGEFDGQQICGPGGSVADFNNTTVFQPARLERQRLLFGLSYQYEMMMAAGQLIMDMVEPADAQNDDADKALLEGEPRQWAVVLELGGVF